MSAAGYTHILFDAGGTLIGTNTDSEHWYEQFFVDRFAEHGCRVGAGDVRGWLKAAAGSFAESSRCSSDAQTRRFWEHVYGETFANALCPDGVAPDEARRLAIECIDRFETGEFVQVFSGAREILTVAKERGYRVGIISNFASYLRHFLQKLELADLVDFMVISAEHGCEKPDRLLFEAGLRQCEGASAERVLYIGDNLDEDYYPARAAGFDALLVDRYGKYAEAARAVDVRTIGHLDEVERYI